MPDEIDDTTAALLGHALVRWVVDTDPAGIARFAPDLDPSSVDDARAARIGHVVGDVLQNLSVA